MSAHPWHPTKSAAVPSRQIAGETTDVMRLVLATAAITYIRARRAYRAAFESLRADVGSDDPPAFYDGVVGFLQPLEVPLRRAMEHLDRCVAAAERHDNTFFALETPPEILPGEEYVPG